MTLLPGKGSHFLISTLLQLHRLELELADGDP
jgi:hypothetical protein